MPIWTSEITLEKIQALSKNTLIDFLNIEFVEIGHDFLIARMPVNATTHQPMRLLHGGATCVLAETAGSMAATFCIDQITQSCVGLSLQTNHIKAVKSGFVTAKATPHHVGKTTQVWAIVTSDDKQNIVASSQLTMIVLNK